MKGYLVDTHIWLWVMRGDRENISRNFVSELDDWQRHGSAFLSPISCWEIGLLTRANRYQLDGPLEEIWERDTTDESFRIAGLTGLILCESTHLPGELHRDPADCILAATARSYDLTLVTRDSKLLDYAKRGHIRARKP